MVINTFKDIHHSDVLQELQQGTDIICADKMDMMFYRLKHSTVARVLDLINKAVNTNNRIIFYTIVKEDTDNG